jgi:hypothetical protein
MAHLSVDPYVSAAVGCASPSFASLRVDFSREPEGGSLSDIMGPQEEDCFMLALRVGDGCKLAAVAREASVPVFLSASVQFVHVRPRHVGGPLGDGRNGTAEDRPEACNGAMQSYRIAPSREFTVKRDLSGQWTNQFLLLSRSVVMFLHVLA